jgi:hypothetical protein
MIAVKAVAFWPLTVTPPPPLLWKSLPWTTAFRFESFSNANARPTPNVPALIWLPAMKALALLNQVLTPTPVPPAKLMTLPMTWVFWKPMPPVTLLLNLIAVILELGSEMVLS